MTAPGLIIAAAASGSGKTVFTLALLRALKRRALRIASAKVGPDYIDPAFHAAASGRPCLNLDGWAMRPAFLARQVQDMGRTAELVVCEGVMGLFDGANVETGVSDGSTADLAARTGWPVILLLDLRRQAASAAAVVEGFRRHRPDVHIAGVVFNQVAGDAHRAMVARACHATCPDLPLLGWLPRTPLFALPERHLGLVQAGETEDLEARLDAVAGLIEEHVDVDGLIGLALSSPLSGDATSSAWPVPPLGQRIAVARDEAFAFAYPAVLEGWRKAGAEVSFFSPLADEAPPEDADAVYLPGGYPELHAARLAAASRFLSGLRRLAGLGGCVYGECGGYMTLGEILEDRDGRPHVMAGLLPVSTSFARRRLHLGYRQCRLAGPTALGPAGAAFRGHEFHYATIVRQSSAQPLFHAADAQGRSLESAGQISGTVFGSFLHLIDRDGD
ncbi:cobyrinate a,c-diamide synthase [Telmatospirillum siberiense]|uniref:Cobyrinate a,c-diamide synthase n=1 Tax=Telmatospirillum siberiense TaxID=382514 RepID=A0A2N3PSK1_9PROT|nr:cobyrinate a,c-diamide synthase [Telmatospirillum siberiense]PKU23378.1 cobyrinic acid a,c-diamide synthase [Telmatospirillum siberiense]